MRFLALRSSGIAFLSPSARRFADRCLSRGAVFALLEVEHVRSEAVDLGAKAQLIGDAHGLVPAARVLGR